MPQFDADRPRRGDYQADYGALQSLISQQSQLIAKLQQQIANLAARPTSGNQSTTIINGGGGGSPSSPTRFQWSGVPATAPTVDRFFNSLFTGDTLLQSLTTATTFDISNPTIIRFRNGSGTSLRGQLENGVAHVAYNWSMGMQGTYITANTTATRGNRHLVDATAGAITILAPNVAAGRVPGEFFAVTKVDATTNPVYVTANTAFPGLPSPGWGVPNIVLKNQNDSVLYESCYDSSSGNYIWRVVHSIWGAYTPVTKTANYTAQGQQHVRVDTTAGNLTMTLPVAADCSGQSVRFQKISGDANTVSFVGQGGDTINLPSWITTLGLEFQWIEFSATGATLWEVVGYGAPIADVMVGATSGSDGVEGLAPQPNAGQEGTVLRGDATWGESDEVLAAANARTPGFTGREPDYSAATTTFGSIAAWFDWFFGASVPQPFSPGPLDTGRIPILAFKFDGVQFCPIWITATGILQVVPLVDAATIATDASTGDNFSVTLGGNRTLDAPSNPTTGQRLTYSITQDGTGLRTLTLTTGSAGAFLYGTTIPIITLTTTAGATDILECLYNADLDRWLVVAFNKGF